MNRDCDIDKLSSEVLDAFGVSLRNFNGSANVSYQSLEELSQALSKIISVLESRSRQSGDAIQPLLYATSSRFDTELFYGEETSPELDTFLGAFKIRQEV